MPKGFSTISSIDPNHIDSWGERLFLTFDIDWAIDEILLDTAALISEADIPATWFVTHATRVLDKIAAMPGQELGIHPNFDPLLDGMTSNRQTAKEIVDVLLDIVPEAKSIRSHSMTQSSRLLDLFCRSGLTHEVNHFIPHHTGLQLKPWTLWNGLVRAPYSWEDDVHIHYETRGASQKSPRDIAMNTEKELMVFDFHPIHVFLNTESLDRYERTRPLHKKSKELIKYRYEGYGTRSRLIELLQIGMSSEKFSVLRSPEPTNGN